jgi:DNA end-binding protein Ku
MARPIWRGSLSFGLVAIPVQMHTAVREHRPKFRLLHAKDKSPIKYERVCQRDGKPVAWEDLVKGYEYERGRYVVLTKEDFKAAALEKDRRVQVSDFVPDDAIDDRYFDQPYYLLPDKGGEHAYAVFQQALAEAGRVGIGKVVMREKQHLVAVESIEGRLVLTMMRFADEVVDVPEASGVDRVKVPARELKLATDLIDALAADWEPEKYADDYQKNLQDVIKGKLKGETVVIDEAEVPMGAEVVDLAERLRRSLEAAGGRKTKTKAKSAKRAARSGRRRAA